MSNQCPKCGGFLKYDILTGQLKCESCDSCMPVEAYSADTAAQHQQISEENYEVTRYICPNCGAEISSTEQSALEYCLYCGSFVTLEQQLIKIRKPDYIVPFSKSKEECKKSYRQMIAHKIYAPKEFRQEEFLDTFKGIYIPYWSYSYDLQTEFYVPGALEYREGDYVINQGYSIGCEGSATLDGINYDASSTFDDEISACVSRSDSGRKKEFHPGYMFGFLGDTADVDSDIYDKDADCLAGDILWQNITANPEVKAGYPKEPEQEDRVVKILGADRKKNLTMIPVWFLTWRKKDKIAYSVVNGESGEIYSEVPVDTKRYLLFSILSAIPIYFLLNVFVTFNGDKLLMMSMFLSCLFILLYSAEVERIVRRLLHSNDKGYLSKHKSAQLKADHNMKNDIVKNSVSSFVDSVFKNGISGVIVLVFAAYCMRDIIGFGALFVVIAAPLYALYRICQNSRMIGETAMIFDIASSVLALVISIAVYFLDPANDMFYYGAAIICLLAIAFTTVRIMIRYNEVITRPVPHFFDRKEASR